MSDESKTLSAPTRSKMTNDPERAWAPYEPDDQRPWDLRRAGHLYRRAGFGAGWSQLQQALEDGPQRAVDKLLRPDADVAAFNRSYDDFETGSSTDGLRAWWLRRMIESPHPLLEKMTLFWHGHFAIGNAKVKNGPLMHRHVQLLRSHALGRFDSLLEAVSRDPAVLLGIDCRANRKAQPNDNYARAMMDNFSLGPGHYCEQDIREAARAFTGWFVLRNQLRYIPREHDAGMKKIFGREGDFDDKDVVRLVLRQPAAPRLLVRKLFRWLISETEEPCDALVAPLAESFAENYDVARLVETMLRSNLFFSPAAYRRRIKGPVEFALGVVKGLEGMIPTIQLGEDLAALGQNLYDPPTVKGWPGGRYWINRATLLGRSNLAQTLLVGKKPYGEKLDPLAVAGSYGYEGPESAGRFLIELFLQGDVPDGVRETLLKAVIAAGGDPSLAIRQFVHSLVALPEFQLS